MERLTYSLNLMLTLTVATLGYWFVTISDPAFAPVPTAKTFLVVSLLALGAGTALGLVCVIVRLSDARGTARRARCQPDAPSKEALNLLGRVCWWTFKGHVVLFALGATTLGIALLLTHGGKLQ